MTETKARCLTVRALRGSLGPSSVKLIASPSPSTSCAYSDKSYSALSTPRELTLTGSLTDQQYSKLTIERGGRFHQLNKLAIAREGRFGTLEFSWRVKNCFTEWRRLAQDGMCSRSPTGCHDNTSRAFLSNGDVIRELQSSLMDRDDAIRRLQHHLTTCEQDRDSLAQELEKHSQVQSQQKARIAELEQLVQDLSEKDGSHQKHHHNLETQLDIHKNRVSNPELQMEEYEGKSNAEWNARLQECSNRLRQEHESHIVSLEHRWQERMTQLNNENARLQRELDSLGKVHHDSLLDAADKYSQLQQEHGVHLTRLKREHGVVLRDAEEEARARLEEEWGLKMRTAQEDHDLRLKQIEEAHIARLKQCCSHAILSLIGGRARALYAISFEGWTRVVERELGERKYEQEINEAEKKHKAVEEDWRASVAELNAKQSQLEKEYEQRLQAAESERQHILHKIEDEQRVTSKDRANKAVFSMIKSNGERFLLVIFHGWMTAAARALIEKDLEAQLRSVDESERKMMQERSLQLQGLQEEKRRSDAAHEKQLRLLAAEEGEKLRLLQEQHDRLRDDLEVRIIQQQEDRKMRTTRAQLLDSRLYSAAEVLASRLLVRHVQASMFTSWIQFVALAQRSNSTNCQARTVILTGNSAETEKIERRVQVRTPVRRFM